MVNYKKAYLSLGSNTGDRLFFLKQVLVLLEQHSIFITKMSGIYESSSWGFESDPFLNACLEIHTTLSPGELMDLLLKIENRLERKRTNSSGYQARTIDLDILFFENEIIQTNDLIIPHPRLAIRNFVLFPLAEITPELIHPILEKSIATLKAQSDDTSHPKALDFNLWSPDIFDRFPYVVIEGNIGAGKTTLTEQIAVTYQVTPLFEAFAKNPHLQDFYKNPETAALAVEQFFLEDRFQTETAFWKKKKEQSVIADYSLYKSLIFAEQNLTSHHLKAYKKRFDEVTATAVVPDLMVFLHQPISRLLENIKRRGRLYEQRIEETYLEKISSGYLNFLKETHPFPILEIDATTFDFKSDASDFQRLLRQIKAFDI